MHKDEVEIKGEKIQYNPKTKKGSVANPNIDWHAKYIQSQHELAEEAGRWSRRIREVEMAYAEKINRMAHDYETTLDEGFEEAYQLLQKERKRSEALAEKLAKLEKEE